MSIFSSRNRLLAACRTKIPRLCIENAVPPIVDVETFSKVQELLKYTQAAAAHKKAKVNYLLTEKLFCGKCGTMMVGVCGTSKTGMRYHYYIYSAEEKAVHKEGCPATVD